VLQGFVDFLAIFRYYLHNMKNFFILGNHPDISRAELESVNRRDELGFTFLHVSPAVAFFDYDSGHSADPKALMATLAGVIKVGIIVDEVKAIDDIPAVALALMPQSEHKVFLGISSYDAGASVSDARKKEKEIGMAIKELARRDGMSLRFVTSREQTLSSVVVSKNHLLDKGVEIVILKTKQSFLIGTTQAVQEFEEYGDRDFARPARDALSGMLPPKLAHIMVNLSECPYNKTILDPFCGSGTILQEALMLGYTHVIGTDTSFKAVNDTQKNIEWIQREKKIDTTAVRVVQSDILDISSLKLRGIHAVVTEPYLGPPLKGRESKQDVAKIYRALDELYASAIERIGTMIEKNGTVVWILPELFGNAFDWPLFWRAIEVCGFAYTSLNSMKYHRNNQYLARIICVFTKTL